MALAAALTLGRAVPLVTDVKQRFNSTLGIEAGFQLMPVHRDVQFLENVFVRNRPVNDKVFRAAYDFVASGLGQGFLMLVAVPINGGSKRPHVLEIHIARHSGL